LITIPRSSAAVGCAVATFDYGTISDAILHVKYTAREDAGAFKNGAVAHLRDYFTRSLRMFNMRHEFPTEWAKFKRVKIEGGTKTSELTLNLREEHYPFWSKGRLKELKRVDLFARTDKNSVEIADKADGTGIKATLGKDTSMGNLCAGKLTDPLPAPIGEFTLYFINNSMEDLWMALTWGK
jgi:hypothetical protein